MNDLKMCDICSGIGGCHLAGRQAGFRTVFAADIDGAARVVYEANLGLRPAGDLAGVDPHDVPGHDALVAGMPCQPWSSAGDLGSLDDTRSHVLVHVLRILAAKRPAAVLWENVAPLATADGGRTLRLLLECLKGLAYRVSWRILRASQFGAAQLRERLFIVGSRTTRRFDFDGGRTTGPGRIRDFLDPSIDRGWLRPEQYTLLGRPTRTPAGKLFAGYTHRAVPKRTGADPRSPWSHDGWRQILDANGMGLTITTRTNTRYLVLIDSRVRRITQGEVRNLMGFPPWFRLGPLVQEAHRQLGNSVYVPCVAAILRAVVSQLFGVRAEPSAASPPTMAPSPQNGDTA